MISLAFHKKEGRGFFGKVISWYEQFRGDNSEYSHVELVLRSEPSPKDSWCFSADEQDHGTRFKYIDLDSTDWTVIDLVATPAQLGSAISYALHYSHERYDWLGILGIALGFHDDKDKFCSEVVTLILQKVYGWWPGVKSWQVTPGGLYDMVMALPEEALA